MIWLERHDDEANMHRFYAIEISRDLFGAVLLTRRWGRIGTASGQTLVQSFLSHADAEIEKQALKKAKRKRGYQ